MATTILVALAIFFLARLRFVVVIPFQIIAAIGIAIALLALFGEN